MPNNIQIQLLSDLHLESPKGYDVFTFDVRAPYLALLGDIGQVVSHKIDFRAFLTAQLQRYRVVFFVPGNHEAYASDWPATLKSLRIFQTKVRDDPALGEFVLLDRRAYRIPASVGGGQDAKEHDASSGPLVILGCSLFSAVPSESCEAVDQGVNDFYSTRDWTVEAHNAAHERDLGWLNEQVQKLERNAQQQDGSSAPAPRVIIFTHWSPSKDPRAVDPRHAASAISPAFLTDLAREPCFASPLVKLWAFGHTHYNCDFEMSREDGQPSLRLLANQRGYYFAQSEGFDPSKVIDV